MSPLWSPGLALPPLCQPGDLLCPDDLALAAERPQCEVCGHLLGPWSSCKKAWANQEGHEDAGAIPGLASSLCS